MNIQAIQTGIVRVKPAFKRGNNIVGRLPRALLSMLGEQPSIDWPIYAWVIDHPEGITVIDTGSLANTPQDMIASFHIQPEEEISAQLKKLGIGIKDVTRVVLTHLHSDHIGGLGFFEHTPIIVHDVEQATLRGLLQRISTHLPAWYNPTLITMQDQPFGAFARSYPLTKSGDVIAVPTPGHTAGHISIVAIQDDRHIFIAGDATYSQQSLIDQRIEGLSFDLSAHPDTLHRIYAHTQQFKTVYLPSHDWESVARLQGSVTVPHAVQRVPGPALQMA